MAERVDARCDRNGTGSHNPVSGLLGHDVSEAERVCLEAPIHAKFESSPAPICTATGHDRSKRPASRACMKRRYLTRVDERGMSDLDWTLQIAPTAV